MILYLTYNKDNRKVLYMKKIILYILMLLALISVANPKCVLADDSDNTLTVNFS